MDSKKVFKLEMTRRISESRHEKYFGVIFADTKEEAESITNKAKSHGYKVKITPVDQEQLEQAPVVITGGMRY